MKPTELDREPRRILIVKPSALGDIVHTLPVLTLLRRRWPNAHIAWLISQNFAGLIDGHPQLDEIIRFDRRGYGQSWRSFDAARGLATFLRELTQRQFDLVIDLQGLLRSGLITAITRAPLRVGFAAAREGAPLCYTHAVPVPTPEMHAVDRNLMLCEAIGCGGEAEFSFTSSAEDGAIVERLTDAVGPFAVLLPGTNWETKKWPAKQFGQLVRPLRERFGLASVLAGAQDAADVARQIPVDLNLSNQTNLRQLVALLRRASLVIANDSGPMHIASALGRPLVTMFGPTNPIRTGPWRRLECVARVDLPCNPCYSRKCSHISCMKGLEIDHVMRVAEMQVNQELKATADDAD